MVMLVRWLWRQHQHHLSATWVLRFTRATSSQAHNVVSQTETAGAATRRTRNIGIIAHIDAGKTTTTERMLFYSGYTRRIGNVDEGSTVTDFLPAERARGITIQSAAITFQWPPTGSEAQSLPWRSGGKDQIRTPKHTINLIDTPGHADFTFEVLRSLRVLDGAICILDGVAGVEAQTEQVWTQAAAYQIPRIIYVNKLDRDGATFARTVKEIGSRLGVWPAVCGIPWWDDKGALKGVGDVVNGLALQYELGGDGRDISRFELGDLNLKDANFATELKSAREALIELLSEHDEAIVEKYLDGGSDAITPNDLIQSLRKCTLQWPQMIAPVFAGASFKNIGVQPLLDAVADLLPSPQERPDSEISFGSSHTTGNLEGFLAGKSKIERLSSSSDRKSGKSLSKEKGTFALQKIEACALAFKVTTDVRRGVLVYVRVYSGSLSRNASVWNTNLQQTERIMRLYRMYADEPVEIDSIEAGSIGVIPGLKLARTGDTLVTYAGANPKTGPPAPVGGLHLRPITVPPPVFFAAVEPNSLSEEKHMKECLELLLREDPSLNVRMDPETGQTQLAGMGELHLEIAGNRLVQDLKAKARIGEIQIGYREALSAESNILEGEWEQDIGGKTLKAGYHLNIMPRAEESTHEDCHVLDLGDNNRMIVNTPKLYLSGEARDEATSLPPFMPIEAILETLKNGTLAAVASGPASGFPIHSADIHFTFDQEKHLFANTMPQALSNMARTMVRKASRESASIAEPHIMEPVMLATISVDEASLGNVVHDINSARGGSIISLGSDEDLPVQNIDIDVSRIYTPADPHGAGEVDVRASESAGGMRQITARVPLKEMVGYLKHLRSLTGGRGTFTMVVDSFETMSGNRQKILVHSMRGG